MHARTATRSRAVVRRVKHVQSFVRRYPSVMRRAACRGYSRCISRVRAHRIASLIARLCSSIVSAASASTNCEPMHSLRSADGGDPRRHGIPYGMALLTETPVRPGAGVRGPPAKVHEARCCRTASPSGSARRARAAERAGWRWPAGESRACRVADGCRCRCSGRRNRHTKRPTGRRSCRQDLGKFLLHIVQSGGRVETRVNERRGLRGRGSSARSGCCTVAPRNVACRSAAFSCAIKDGIPTRHHAWCRYHASRSSPLR